MGVAARLEGDRIACGYMGVVVADVIAVGMAFSLADAGGDAGVRANGYANAAAGVAVGTAIAVAVLRSQQVDLVVGDQGGILACRDVAALDKDIAVFTSASGDEVDVAASLHATAMAARAALIAVALAFAGADRDGDGACCRGVARSQGTGGVTVVLALVVGVECRCTSGQSLHARIAGLACSLGHALCRLTGTDDGTSNADAQARFA